MYSISMTTDDQSLDCIRATSSVLGDKWTPQLLFVFAAQDSVRFCQLQEQVGGINPRTLSARLCTLEQHAIIKKLPSGATSRCEYQLTAKGHDLLPVISSMASWGDKYPTTNVSDLSQQTAVG